MLRVNEETNQTFSDLLQDNFQTISDFVKRTDALAVREGLNLSEIHGLLGISKAMVFAYRSGKSPITQKVWLKLESAEAKTGGELTSESGNAESSGNPKQVEAKGTPQPTWDYSSRGRDIPVIGWAHAGDAASYEEIPRAWQNRIATDCADPKAFGVSLEGDSMEPKFSDGDILIVQPSTEIHSGCYVVVRFANDGVLFRRLEMSGSKITLVPLNSQYQTSEHAADEFSWIYPVYMRITRLWRK